jgi:TP901 family phage tail tape measure protein
MANTTETARATVYLDGKKAGEELKRLRKEANLLKSEMNSLKLKGDKAGFENKKREFDGVKKKIDEAKRSTYDLNTVLKNLNGSSVKDLSRAQNTLTREIQNANRATKEERILLASKTAQLRQVKIALASVRAEMAVSAVQSGTAFSRFSSAFSMYFGMLATGVAGVVALIASFRKLITIAHEWEQAVAGLSALTGLVGRELDWLSDKARLLAKNGTDAGVKIVNSAVSIVDAYKMMGSNKPELLKNKEALDQVTQAALTLSSAAGMEAAPAVEALAVTMNQFSAKASEANRYINALAAGSKYGAAFIPLIAESMTKFGAVADNANISVEQSIALIETLSLKGIKGAAAGQMLKTALLKMQVATDDINPKLVGMTKALENLSRKGLSTAEMVDIFGLRAYVAAQILSSGVDTYKRFEQNVTGTSIALEQATINTDTHGAALERARNRMAMTSRELGEKLAPMLTHSTKAFNYFVKAILALPKFVKQNQVALLLLAGTYIYLNTVKLKLIAVTVFEHLTLRAGIGLRIREAVVLRALIVQEQMLIIWKGKGSIASKAAASAQWLWNAAVAANPIGAAIFAVIALIAAIKHYSNTNAQAVARQKEVNATISWYRMILESAKKKLSEHIAMVDKMNSLSYQEKLDLRDKIRLTEEFTRAKIAELKVRIADIQAKNNEATAWQKFGNSLRIHGKQGVSSASETNRLDASRNAYNAVKPMLNIVTDLEQELDKVKDKALELDEIFYAEKNADKIVAKSMTEYEEKARLLTLALRNSTIGSEDYLRINEKLKAVNKVLLVSSGEEEDSTKKKATAYQLLSQAIADATEKMQELILQGDYQSSAQAGKVVQNLTNQKKVIDGIIASHGDVNAYLESLTDSTEGELEEEKESFRDFYKSIEESSKAWYKRQEELKEEKTQRDIARTEAEIARDEIVRDEKIKLEEDWKKAYLAIADSVANAGYEIFSNHLQAKTDAEMARLNKMRERELSNKNLTEEQKAAIDRKYEAQERKIKQNQWKKQKKADIIMSLVRGALTVAGALAAPPFWPLNSASVITAGIASGLQTAVIAAQPMPQFYEGGPTGPGTGLKDENGRLAGMVHSNEYVIPEWMRSLPRVIAFERVLEGIRLSKGASSVQTPQTGKTPPEYFPPSTVQPDTRLVKVLEALNVHIEKGIKTKFILNDFEKVMAKLTDIEGKSSL